MSTPASIWANCPVCLKLRRATPRTRRLRNHRRWNGYKMIWCAGSMRQV